MNKRIAISVITVLAVGVSAAGYFVLQQSNKLGEAGSEIVALEDNVSALEENVSTLEENGSILEVKLTDLEAKVSTLEADLDKANDDVELPQKLVGTGGWYQSPPQDDGTYIQGTGSFTLLNPDCVSEITIDRILFFSLYGEVIYDSVEDGWPDEDQPWTEPVKPHEIRWIEVDSLMQRLERPPADVVFTIEVFWTGAREGLPLTGWANTSIVRRNTEGGILGFESMAETQMVNMEQALGP